MTAALSTSRDKTAPIRPTSTAPITAALLPQNTGAKHLGQLLQQTPGAKYEALPGCCAGAAQGYTLTHSDGDGFARPPESQRVNWSED